MINNIRHINLGEVGIDLPPAIISIMGTEPTILHFYVNEMVFYTGTVPDDRIKKAPEGIPSIQYTNVDRPFGLLWDSNVIAFSFWHQENMKAMERVGMASVIRMLKKHSVEVCRKNPDSNDLVFDMDGKAKKFTGFAMSHVDNWNATNFFISLEVNYDLMKDIYHEDPTDKVGGIREVDPSLSYSLAAEIATDIANSLDSKITTGNLTIEELAKIKELVKK